MITYTRDELDLKIKLTDPPLEENAAFSVRRDLGWKQFMAEYSVSLRNEEDTHIIANTFSAATPPDTGAEKVDTIIGDAYKVEDLPADFEGVRGDKIWIKNGTDLIELPRITFEDIIVTGGETTLAFTENVTALGVREVLIYSEQGAFADDSDVHFEYFRTLGYTFVDGDSELDIREGDFQEAAEKTAEYMKKNL